MRWRPLTSKGSGISSAAWHRAVTSIFASAYWSCGSGFQASQWKPTQANAWPPDQRARYQALVARCDYETLVSARYTPSCMQRRDRYMVDHASLLIAAFDGSAGGTRYTVEYAMRQKISIVDLPIL